MIASTQDKPVAHPFRPDGAVLHARRRAANVVAVIVTTAFAVLASLFLLYLVAFFAIQGSHYLNLNFFTQPPGAFGTTGGGVGPAIVGSAILIALASAIGIPLGLFTGIYLSEFGRGSLASGIRFLVDTLTGLPTIIFGLFAWILIVVPERSFSAVSGGVALGIIMIPTMARATEEVLRLVPRELREASVALGATESRTILRVVVPAARSGIVTGIVLALARVGGETAPLIMTAFGNSFFNYNIFRAMAALPLQVYVYTESPYDQQINQAYAGAFVLLVLVVLASLAVRWATGGFKRTGR